MVNTWRLCSHAIEFTAFFGFQLSDVSVEAQNQRGRSAVIETLPIRYQDSSARQPISLAVRAFHSPTNDDSVIRLLDQHAGLHVRELIIQTKHWRKSLADKSLTWLKSAHIEFACLQAVSDVAPGQGFRMTFGRVLTLISRGLENSDLAQVLAVKDSYMDIPDKVVEAVRVHAKKALSKMGLKVKEGEAFLFLKPSEIRFTQAKCSPNFRNGSPISETYLQLADGSIEKRDVEMLRVVEYNRDGNMYSVDNRRLAVFRLLEQNGHAKVVKVRVLARSELHEGEWKKKFSTTTDGRSITISGPEGWTVGINKEATSYPFNSSAPASRDNRHVHDLSILDSDDDGDGVPETKKRKVDQDWDIPEGYMTSWELCDMWGMGHLTEAQADDMWDILAGCSSD